jgi:hypothetical protein
VTVAGNTYVAETVVDALRGRIFAAMESIIRVALLASMVVTAPVGDLVAGIVRRVIGTSAGSTVNTALNGPRITLVFASLIVIAAAVFAAFAIDWRSKRADEDVADA